MKKLFTAALLLITAYSFGQTQVGSSKLYYTKNQLSIGSSAPASQLSPSDPKHGEKILIQSSLDTVARMVIGATGTGAADIILDADDGDLSTNNTLYIRNRNDHISEIRNAGSNPLILGVLNVPSIQIDAIGRVGITNEQVTVGNLFSPLYTLDIRSAASDAADLAFRIMAHDSDDDSFSITNNRSANGEFAPALNTLVSTNDNPALIINSCIAPSLDVGTNDNAVTKFISRIRQTSGIPLVVSNRPLFSWYNYDQEQMQLNEDGNLGIGTTDFDGFKLAVAGSIRATEIKVEALPWPDYVFASNYQLMSLSDLRVYIQQNNHLPGVPSAAQVEEDGGIKLGEMNTILLQKIEELTLYNLQLEEQLAKANADIDELKNLVTQLSELKKAVADLQNQLGQ